jgi:acyl-CoA synthetase (AMP-forming)/AMP-acid ligase II
MEMHFATLWESIADEIGDREALICGDVRRTWAEYEDRAARLGTVLSEAGLSTDSKLGLYLFNSVEYAETQFAAFKQRCVPININYRYLDDELHYLIDNSDSEALVFHTSLGDRVARVMDRCPDVKLWIGVDDGGELPDGAVRYEDVLAASDPAKRIARSPDDVYMLYTGGTTGMPKGVMYDMGGMLQGFIQLGFPILGLGLPDVNEIAGLARTQWEKGAALTAIPGCPMMHGTGAWLGLMIPHCTGAKVVSLTSRSFDAHELWQTAAAEKASQLVIVGDAFGKPMIRALEEAKERGEPHDVSSVKLIVSSGVMFTSEVKSKLLEWGEFMLIDAMGSSEGSMGTQVTTRGNVGQTARFTMSPTTKVFTEDGREVQPGSGETGMVAAGGTVPLGYYKDEKKSQATFRTVDGVRYSFPGDWASIEADGTLNLLGRGSNCINTAGEKVYPEEVEEAVKQHPDVVDCLVVGVDDEKFGQRVTAVASLKENSAIEGEAIRAFTREKLAAYKVPKQVFVVPQVMRAPNGKADYKWARQTVLEEDA